MDTTNLEIQEYRNEHKGEYYIEADGQKIAEMTYTFSPERMIISHTEVKESQRNQGIALKLVMHAVDQARKEGFKILPLCPYARSVFLNDRSIHDVMV